MKKSLFLGLVATALMFTACKKEEAAHDHEAMTQESAATTTDAPATDAPATDAPAPEATPCDKAAVNADGTLQGEGNTGCTLSE